MRAPAPPRLLRATLWASSAFAAAYLLQGGLQLGGLVYDPLAHRAFIGTPAGTQMRYFGDVLGATLAAALASALALLVPLREPFDPRLLAGSTLALVGLDLAFFFSRVLAAS